MAVRVQLDSHTLPNLLQYAVQEDSTPINPADESGGTAQINFTVPRWPGWKSIEDRIVELRDDTQGFTRGRATTAADSNGLVQITSDSRILQLATRRTAQPYRGTLSGALRYYFSLVGIVDGIVIDETFGSQPVVFPGWEDNVYQRVARGICPAFGVEMSLVSGNIVVRYPRQRKAVLTRLSEQGIQEAIDSSSRAQRTKLNWATTRWVQDQLVYPTGGWNTDVEILDVNAGQVKVYETVEVSASLTSIVQPQCVVNVGPDFDSASVYTVAGSDGKPIPPEMWKAYGGDLRVEINPDTRSLKVTIRGMDFAEYGPYQIAVSSGDGSSYSTLRIIGTGVVMEPQIVDMGTGYDADKAPDEYGVEATNDFITNVDQAYHAAAWQVAGATGPARTISFGASGINRASDSGSAVFATVEDWDAEFEGMTTDDWDAVWAGESEEAWAEFWSERVDSSFANQAFGNVAGARVVHSDSIFRIRTSTNSAGVIQAEAEVDNTVEDFDRFFAGMTTDDWDVFWSPRATHQDFDVAPFPGIRFDGLRPGASPLPAGRDVFPSVSTFPSPVLFPHG